ncbi:MAG: TetR/AcrR family transcriptional regulator C-terminal domain-containing protein [Halanaerobiaceae bacterium]
MARQYTKNLIREVFVQMLNKKPLDKITVKDIAEKCDINRNTFYYHYADIYEILSEIFEREIQRIIKEYNETLSWEESFLVAARFALENKKAIFHVYHSMRREELEDYIYEVSGNIMMSYIERISKKISASSGDKKLIATFYQSALTEMVLRWIGGGMKGNPEKIIRRIGQLFNGNIELSLKRSKDLDNIWEKDVSEIFSS